MQVLQSTHSPNFRIPLQAGEMRTRVPSKRVERADGVVRHLGPVARRRRKEANVIVSQVIARLHSDFGVTYESDGPLSRFERSETTPKDLDAVIAAYAVETNAGVAEFWAEALEHYLGTTETSGEATAAAGAALEVEAQDLARQQAGDRATPARGSRARKKKQAGG